MPNPSLLLLGYGQINRAIAERLQHQFEITACSRSTPASTNIRHHAVDLTEGDLSALSWPFQLIVYCLTPDQYTAEGYQRTYVQGLKNVLQYSHSYPPRRLFFVSSTSVYDEAGGAWVNEHSSTSPSSATAQALVEAEQLLTDSPLATTSLRCSGIYGGHRRRLLDAIRAGNKSAQGDGPWTNRIHEEDVVGAVCHLLTQAAAGEELEGCYLLSDDEPVQMPTLVRWVQNQTPCAPPSNDTHAPRGGSKRCDNQRLKASGYRLKYPTYREGYGKMIAALKTDSDHR